MLAWLVPSVATLAVFATFVYPDISSSVLLRPLARLSRSPLSASIVFIFSALLLGMLFSLASRPIYRVLEGYQLPRAMKRWLLRRQIRTWLILRRRYDRTPARLRAERGMLRERLGDYPRHRENLLPTRLRNAFKTMETFGVDRFSLDSQTFWYELNALAPERARRDADDARASVDFFISFVAHLALLSVVSLVVAATAQSASALVIGLMSGALIKVAYDAAVRNMTDWRYAVQALVNLGRSPLAAGLGYELPAALAEERKLWRAWGQFVRRGEQQYLSKLDEFRLRPADKTAKGDALAAAPTDSA